MFIHIYIYMYVYMYVYVYVHVDVDVHGIVVLVCDDLRSPRPCGASCTPTGRLTQRADSVDEGVDCNGCNGCSGEKHILTLETEYDCTHGNQEFSVFY